MNSHPEAIGFKVSGSEETHYQAVPGIPAGNAIEQAYCLLDSVEGCLSEAISGGYFDPVLLRLAVRAAMASCMTVLGDLPQGAAQ